MGEHKFPKASNGDEENKPTVTPYICEAFTVVLNHPGVQEDLARAIETAYLRISERAKQDDSFIVTCQSQQNSCVMGDSVIVLVTVSAQRIGREDLERQQRLQRMGGR